MTLAIRYRLPRAVKTYPRYVNSERYLLTLNQNIPQPLPARIRPRCERCLRPLSHCLCPHIKAVSNLTRVLILQHPDEHKHPLNTARLAALGLENADLYVGEHFPDLAQIIAAAEAAWLLFPSDGEQTARSPSGAEPLTRSTLLIVPDGTWRKARRIVSQNPVLETLPRFSLPANEPSRYRIRKARERHHLSTVEAIVRALSMLEPHVDFSPVLKPFEVLVEQQINAMGRDTFERNYGGREKG